MDEFIDKYIKDLIQQEIEIEREVFKENRFEAQTERLRQIYTHTNWDVDMISKRYLMDEE